MHLELVLLSEPRRRQVRCIIVSFATAMKTNPVMNLQMTHLPLNQAKDLAPSKTMLSTVGLT
jgi:hypothetical protein